MDKNVKTVMIAETGHLVSFKLSKNGLWYKPTFSIMMIETSERVQTVDTMFKMLEIQTKSLGEGVYSFFPLVIPINRTKVNTVHDERHKSV